MIAQPINTSDDEYSRNSGQGSYTTIFGMISGRSDDNDVCS